MDVIWLYKLAVLPFSFLLFFTIAVAFGAPFLQKFYETAVWSLLVTLIGVLPLTTILPSNLNSWRNNLFLMKHGSFNEKWCVYNFFSVLVGSWIGAILLLLDWNTLWQAWPFPCCVGSAVGSVISLLVALTLKSAS